MKHTGLAFLCALALVACDDTSDPVDAATLDANPCQDCGRDGAPPGDAGSDAGRDAGGGMDSGSDSGPAPTDGGGIFTSDASVGSECLFNYECTADQFCECTASSGCSCQVGARGTARLGEACTDNSDCLNGNCLTSNDVTACTMPCDTVAGDSSECGGLFPDCDDIPF